MDVLYQAEIREQLPSDALSQLRKQGWTVTLPDPSEADGSAPGEGVIAYTTVLVEGVEAHSAEIDELIDRFADRWAIARMPVVDKNLLRLGIFELLWVSDVPTAVVINEAVEMAKSFSTDDSGRFVNGILGRAADELL